jgi:hypothetical protein
VEPLPPRLLQVVLRLLAELLMLQRLRRRRRRVSHAIPVRDEKTAQSAMEY